MKFSDISQFPRFYYEVDVLWSFIESTLENYAATGLDLEPDFQRAHVWAMGQRVAYIEYSLRGGEVGRQIIFNQRPLTHACHACWGPMVLIDGKQRLESVRMFLGDELRVFGRLHSEFEGQMRLFQNTFKFRICNLGSKADYLRLYLAINAGGTPHTKEELDAVRDLLAAEVGNE